MLNSKQLSLVNKIGDKTEFTITRVHCILIFLIGQSLQCIQCGKMENNFQCTDSDTGVSTECSSETTYCQNITTNKFTFKSCGIMDFGHEIDGQDECILDFVRNFRLKIINYTYLVPA